MSRDAIEWESVVIPAVDGWYALGFEEEDGDSWRCPVVAWQIEHAVGETPRPPLPILADPTRGGYDALASPSGFVMDIAYADAWPSIAAWNASRLEAWRRRGRDEKQEEESRC